MNPLLSAAILLGVGHAAPPSESMLERARAALGPWPGKDVQLEGRGKARASGVDGKVEVR